MAGGMSALFVAILELFFAEDGHDMHKAGIYLQLSDGSNVRIFVKVDMVVSDEPALHALFACKGSGGLKPCISCSNVFNYKNARQVVEKDETNVAVYHTCTDVRKLRLHTAGTIRALAARLAAAAPVLSKAKLAELETRLGWNYAPRSCIFVDRMLAICNPSDSAVFDWMHVYFVNGIFNTHVGQLMISLKEHGITYARLHTYLQQWHWPTAMSGALDIFAAKRAKNSWDDKHLKVTASEGLSVLPILANFVHALHENTALASVKDHASCFLKLADVIRIIQRSARHKIDADELQYAIAQHLSAFKKLYGEDVMTPKFHYSIHFPSYLRRWGWAPACFVLERKHKVPKRFANEVRNTSGAWETSVLREVTCHHLAALTTNMQHFAIEVGLQSPHSRRLVPLLQEDLGVGAVAVFATAKTARINAWERCSKGDVVLFTDIAGHDHVGNVELHVSVRDGGGQAFVSVVQMWSHISNGPRSSKWRRRSDAGEYIMTEDIKCCVVWGGTDDIATVLNPWQV